MKIKKQGILKLISILQEKCNNTLDLNDYIDISKNEFEVNQKIEKFVITITDKNKENLQTLLSKFKLGVGWFHNQSLFYNPNGFKGFDSCWTWNTDENNKVHIHEEPYKEIYYKDLLKILDQLKK